jgi:hypothetical protein
MKFLGATVLLVLIPLGAGTAYADSDGYYCIGRGYLAYQFGFAAPPTRPHRLSVILDENSRPVGYEVRPFPDGQKIPQEFILSQIHNLGASSGARAYLKPVRVRLSARERGGAYLLEIIAKAIPPLKRCELAITSRIVETDRNGREISARIIFQGRGYRECGE